MRVQRFCSFVATVSVLMAPWEYLLADPLDEQRQAVAIIVGVTNDICQQPPPTSVSGTLELSAGAKASLNAILKKLADLGFDVGAKYKSENSAGVLQKDLAQSMKDSNTCKFNVLSLLQEKLILPVRTTEGKVTVEQRIVAGDKVISHGDGKDGPTVEACVRAHTDGWRLVPGSERVVRTLLNAEYRGALVNNQNPEVLWCQDFFSSQQNSGGVNNIEAYAEAVEQRPVSTSK